VNPTEVAVTIAVLVVLFAMILMAQPIWLSLAVSGGVGLLLLNGPQIAVSAVGAAAYNSTAAYALVVIPMFVLMGVLAGRSGLAADIFSIAQRATRRIPGGLGVATILACGGFSAVTGSTSATVATIGRISVDQMIRRGYRPNAAAALVALGATLGVLIPPSVLMVIFGILTGQSIGRLLLAGLIPGLITMLFYIVAVVLFYSRGYFEPRTAKEKAVVASYAQALTTALDASSSGSSATRVGTANAPAEAPTSTRITARNIRGALLIGLLFTIVIGGMYSGLFTSTEAGAVAAATATVIAIMRGFRTGAKEILISLKNAFTEAGAVSSMIFALIFGGAIFAFFLLKTGLPNEIARNVVAAGLPPLMVIIVSLVMLIILGALLDEVSILLIVIPLLWPVLNQMGVDGIWYGVLAMKATAIGLIAPPVGINVFVASGVSKHVSTEGIYKAILPFFLVEIVVIAVLIAFPQISTFLPDLMLG
jgi:C4-dicarboxylate transporter DctM subunit